MRRQYLEQKARQPDAILFFRLGDFYETFDDDAKLVAAELGITLTSKPMGGGLRAPLAGVPVAHVESHLARLVARGHRVAICEQLEDPRAARGLVRRGVVRVLSPGTALEPALLEAGEPSACAALTLQREPARGGGAPGRGAPGGGAWLLGLAALDLSTGACHALELRAAALPELAAPLAAELARLGVRELLLGPGLGEQRWKLVGAELDGLPLRRTGQDRRDGQAGLQARGFGAAQARRALAARWGGELGREPAAALGLEERPAALAALGGVLELAAAALPADAEGAVDGGTDDEAGGPAAGEGRTVDRLAHLAPPRLLEPGARLQWDAATQRALAIVDDAPGGAGRGSDAPRTLLQTLDRCGSAAGRRWLRAALLAPLLDQRRIETRLDRIAALRERAALRRAVRAAAREAPDLERLLARLAAGLARPAELAALARGLLAAAALAERIRADVGAAGEAGEGGGHSASGNVAASGPVEALAALAQRLGPAPAAAHRLAAALLEQPEAAYGGGVLRAGVDAAVDAAAARRTAGRARLAVLETTLRAESGLAALKLGYHRSWGYYIEVTRGQLGKLAQPGQPDAVPAGWERRQSLRASERFSEPRLRALADELADAERELSAAERGCVERLALALSAEAAAIRGCAGALARLDAAAALAELAAERDWRRPRLDAGLGLRIEAGRHPIVEAGGDPAAFVANDLELDAGGAGAPQLLLLTGPNMSGKSTYLRQAALIVILAQAGCFVPAAAARIGLVDRIFARVGAQDDLAAGRSTFLVEMLETARLLHGAGERSLVLLDEVGRGTSTWDGLAIAQAVAERLVAGRSGPRTLFATHFQELTALAGSLERVANAAVTAEEDGRGGLRFLHRVAAGAADRSWGVQVAAIAGLPRPVLERAAELLAALESGAAGAEALFELAPPPARAAADQDWAAGAALLDELAALDVDGLTPLEAISALYALREQARLAGDAPRPAMQPIVQQIGQPSMQPGAPAAAQQELSWLAAGG